MKRPPAVIGPAGDGRIGEIAQSGAIANGYIGSGLHFFTMAPCGLRKGLQNRSSLEPGSELTC
jgi:hypothetical protein